MRIYQILPQNQKSMLKEAVAPRYGATASLYSTQYQRLYSNSFCSGIIFHANERTGELYNLLPNIHYFCDGLAKCPVALVIRVEGEISPLKLREVAA